MTGELVERGAAALSAVPGQAVQAVGGQYATAVGVQNPRKIEDVKRRVEVEALLSGERFFYGWGAGKDRIEGPSVKLAMTVVRCWGNCAVEMQPVQDLRDAWVFTAAFIDLETGYTLTRQFRMSKDFPVAGKHDKARKDDIRFQIGQSKAIRNVVLNAVPIGLIDYAMDAAKSEVRGKMAAWVDQLDRKHGKGKGEGVAAAALLDALKAHGADEARVLAKLEVADRKAVDLDRLVILQANRAALDRGEVTVDELFPAPEKKAPAKLADKLTAGREEKPPAGAEAEAAADADGKPADPHSMQALFGGDPDAPPDTSAMFK